MELRTNNARRGKSGFTLLEVSLSVAILGLTIASTLVALRSGFAMIESARDNTLASQILQSEMENLRLKGWNEISALSSEEFFIDSTFGSVDDRFTCFREVADVRPSLRLISLEVTWTTSSGREVTRRYGTLFSKSGLNDYYWRVL